MTLQIRAISIYSHEGEVRDVEFRLNALNVVSGASKTGKSALLDIVDYCWGRKECNVAEGVIRMCVSWFAVHFDHRGEGILVARKNPGTAEKTSDQIYFARGVEERPNDSSVFYKNITRPELRSLFSSILGISENIHVPKEGSTREPLKVSSGHAIIFCMQSQGEIANRDFLFHRQGDSFVRQDIRDSLPYFLGAVDENHFISVQRLHDLKRNLRKLKRDNDDVLSIEQDINAKALSLYQEAQRFGLIASDVEPVESESVIARLQAVESQPMQAFAIDGPQADISELDDRRRNMLERLQNLREEISKVKRLNRSTEDFETEAREQEARLTSIGLISEIEDVNHNSCPLCESRLDIPVPTVDEIRGALSRLQTQLRTVHADKPRLQKRLSDLESEREELSEQLRFVQDEIAKRIQDNERLYQEPNQFVEQARVAGRIGYYLESRAMTEPESDLPRRIRLLNAQIEELQRIVDDAEAEDRLMNSLTLVGRDLAEFGRKLDLEHCDYLVRIDHKRLTVVAETETGGIYLSQMGSGQNWVGYHVGAHLSLHKHFHRRQRPVPSFLLLDQPSQAHYPPDLDQDQFGRIDNLRSEDQNAVLQLFSLLNDFCADVDPMQLIVIDHVELREKWFEDAMVQRWRDGDALVPDSWQE